MSSSSSKPKRYFVNALPDYDGAPIPLERELWVERCRDTVQRVFTHQGTGFDDCDGGLYVGVAGVAFMAHRVAQSPHFVGDRARLLTKAQTYLGHALSYCDQPQVRADRAMQSAFLLGSAGVWALAAVVANEVGRHDDCDNFLARCYRTRRLHCCSILWCSLAESMPRNIAALARSCMPTMMLSTWVLHMACHQY